MFKTMLVASRDRVRLSEIARITSSFGLSVIMEKIGLQRADTSARGDGDLKSLPHRTRLALEELGPTFIKLGQILATRGDLLSPEWIAEFEKLHSSAPTLPFDQLREGVEQALGGPPEEVFATFAIEPLAAASMAQVHRATLLNGKPVVVKIRRPGIRPRMEADLRLIAQMAELAESTSAEARRLAPAEMVRQLAEAVLAELDFTNEGRNADRLRADMFSNTRVTVPEIHWAYTSETVLVMDFIDGIPPRNGNTLRKNGIDPAAIAMLGADMVLDMVLINGRFHADPHPGNLLCLPGNRMALLDLGMIGHVSPRRREQFIGFTQSLSNGDPALLANVLTQWSERGSLTPDRAIKIAERLISNHSNDRIVLSAMVTDFLALMRDEGLTMPPDLLLIFKALITLDGVLTAIEPDFDLSKAMRQASLRIARAKLSPDNWMPTLNALAWELSKLGDDAPQLLRDAKSRLSNPTNTPVDHHLYDQMILTSGRLIAGSIFAGALCIAISIALT